MSQEEKAKAYDETIERAKKELNACGSQDCDAARQIFRIFPELKESEDDRIRKAAISFLEYYEILEEADHNSTEGIKECIAWLEKQGEQKTADRVEPKFKVGDWVVHDMSDGRKVIRQIINMTNKSYVLDGEAFNTFYFNDLETDFHLWTIQDAKDGDVLANKYGAIFINAGSSYGGGTLNCYCYLSVQNEFCIEEHKTGSWFYKEDIKPATKEQRDLLFQKMKEAGYEWDDDKKELKKVSQRMVSAETKEALYYNKPAWSEEDETNASYICAALDCYYRLREERNNTNGQEDLDKARNWLYNKLKFLRPQNRWKPSEEQMKAVKRASNGSRAIAGNDYLIMESLYNDLQKLREE